VPVVNLDAGHGVRLAPGSVPGRMHIYCVGPLLDATVGISIYNPPPPYTWHRIPPGDTREFQVDGFETWVVNRGPSRVQLLIWALALEGVSIEDVEGASAWDDDEEVVKPESGAEVK
jgi:hypothetical protein